MLSQPVELSLKVGDDETSSSISESKLAQREDNIVKKEIALQKARAH